MNNKLDKQYTDLLQDILDNGIIKQDRTGTGTTSVFGRQIRHKMSEGFPLLTTKKMAWKTMVVELLWFLRGDTNIKFLVDNGCNIWNGDAYKNYLVKTKNQIEDPNDLNWDLSSPKDPKITQLTQEQFINKIKTDDEFAKKWGELGPIYGKQWRSWKQFIPYNLTEENCKVAVKVTDQIQNLINDLKTNPDSRRLMVSAYNVGELDSMVLPPCHYGFQVYTRELSARERTALGSNGSTRLYDRIKEGNYETVDADIVMHQVCDEGGVPKRAISLMWNQRSADLFLGIPFNIASYGLLLEIIATSVNMIPDELIGNLGDVHLYNNHIEQAKEQIGREPFELPKLNINTEFWPYEGGECGVGPLDAVKVFESFKNDNFCKCLLEEDIQLSNYQSHPTIKAPLSN
jgi:thymidylate synthase